MPIRITHLIAVLLLIPALITSCKKSKSDSNPNSGSTTTSSPYHISWAYQPMPGVPSYASLYQFVFTSDAPAGSNLSWDFGDGSTDTAITPTHTYTAMGTYTVTLTVNGNTANKAVRTLDVYHSLMPHKIICATMSTKDSLLHFTTNVLPDSTFFWDFGDGITSADSTPTHAYAANGSYIVKLTVNGSSSTVCSTMVHIMNPPPYSSAIGGIRNWHDTSYTYMSTPATITYPRPNQSFAVDVTNPFQIKFQNATLQYQYSTDSVGVYGWESIDNTGNNHNMYLTYYHYSDSIVVTSYDRVSAGGATGQKWMTY